VEAIRKNQLNRALRVDKLTLLALEETLRLYRDEVSAIKEIPTLRMICEPYSSLQRKATRLLRMVGKVDSGNFSLVRIKGVSKVGGGALPLLELATCLLALVPGNLSAQFMENWLRTYETPIIGRVERERLLLDVRTVQEFELKVLARAIVQLMTLHQE